MCVGGGGCLPAANSPPCPSLSSLPPRSVFDSSVPFGGYKSSGIGRDKGAEALHSYTVVKAVYNKLEGDKFWS